METFIFLAGVFALFRAAIQQERTKRLEKENKEMKLKLGR